MLLNGQKAGNEEKAQEPQYKSQESITYRLLDRACLKGLPS